LSLLTVVKIHYLDLLTVKSTEILFLISLRPGMKQSILMSVNETGQIFECD